MDYQQLLICCGEVSIFRMKTIDLESAVGYPLSKVCNWYSCASIIAGFLLEESAFGCYLVLWFCGDTA
jgi:hypothetical protein